MLHFITENSGSTTSQKMLLNKFTLTFKDDNETKFQTKYFHDSLIQFRVSFILVIFLYAIFGYLDTMLAEEYVAFFIFIRFAIVIPLFLFTFLFSYHKNFSKVWQWLLFVCFITGGAGITIMTLLLPENYAYYAGLMLIFSAGYFFIKLRFSLASIAGWLTLLLFNIGAFSFSRIEPMMILFNNFFFISANIIGMFAAYYIEYYSRRDFIMNQQLDKRNADIVDANKNLESKVEERTRELIFAKEKAEESDNLKTAFLHNISHEIRTPFNGILGFLQIIKEDEITTEEKNHYFEIIDKSANRLMKTIYDIVEVSQIQTGQVKLSFSEINISKLMDELLNNFSDLAKTNNIEIILNRDFSDFVSLIKTDSFKLSAILSVLIDNALKFTDKGSVEFGIISKEKTPDFINLNENMLCFYVKDTGVGIPKDKQTIIFEKFMQADVSDTRAYEGSGLGLSIAKAYVEMLNGSIWLESEENKGSCFYFTIPLNPIAIEKKQVSDIVSHQSANKTTKKLKVLIAEDDITSVIFFKVVLKNYISQLLEAKTGNEAIEIYKSNPDIDLILMDLKMPDMNGYEASKQIKMLNKEVIIIAQTAFAQTGDREKALEAGCDDYITKPIKKEELLALIQKYFNK